MSRPEENDASWTATMVLLALFVVVAIVGVVTVALPELGRAPGEAPDAGPAAP